MAIAARNTWYWKQMRPGGVPSLERKYPDENHEIAAPAEPSSTRKNAESASTRTWNGRSGRPSGSVAASCGAPIARNATTASATPTAAPAGNSTRLTMRSRRSAAMPSAPIASHATMAARISVEAEGVTGTAAGSRAVRGARGGAGSFHAHSGDGPRVRREKENARTLARCGEHHPLGQAELHLARREVG